MIVVDTNVIAYFYIRSEHSSQAEEILKMDPDWAAPKLWRSEFCNILIGYVRRKEFGIEDALEKVAQAEFLIGANEYSVSSRRVLELANSSGCSAYDCEFVALAEQFGVRLVTSDKKILGAFPDIAVSMLAFVR